MTVKHPMMMMILPHRPIMKAVMKSKLIIPKIKISLQTPLLIENLSMKMKLIYI